MDICGDRQHCVTLALKRAEELSLKNNVQFTKLRRNVLELIWKSHKPLKAYDILELLKTEEYSAKPITVYRALDFLLGNEMIHKLESKNTFFGCSHPGDQHNCYFMICKKCDAVEEGCESDSLKNIYEDLKKRNFKVDHITLEISGICDSCVRSALSS